MAQTVIRGTQILNNTVQRQDLDTSTVGQAVVTKLVQGTNVALSSTGADSGTGDVTISASGGLADAPNDANTYGRHAAAWSPTLPTAGGTLTGSLTIQPSSGVVCLTLSGNPIDGWAQQYFTKANGSSGVGCAIVTTTGTPTGYRWALSIGDSTVESGSNAGSDFKLEAYSDAAASLGVALKILRASLTATFGGPVILAADPSSALGAATKQYVDAKPAPPAPSGTTPVMDGIATIGVGTTYARADHIHPSDTSRMAVGAAPTAHEASHVTGSDQIPLASSSTKGLLNQTSGNTTDFIDGTNNSQALQPVIWSARLRSFNAIGNSTFEVDQRNVATALTNPANGTFIQDRYAIFKSVGLTGTVNTALQSVPSAPIVIPGTNFGITQNYQRFTVGTAQASLAAGDFYGFSQNLEGPRWRELSMDVHSVSILVRSSVAGLAFSMRLRDFGVHNSLVKLCTISSANTWTLIPLPNLPVWVGTYSAAQGQIAYLVDIFLACGSTYLAAANAAWQTGDIRGVTGMSNLLATSGATFDIAFVQHEPGALCTTPIDCSFDENYDRCLRYFQKTYDYTTVIGTATGLGMLAFLNSTSGVNSAVYQGYAPFLRPMAKIPTVTIYNHSTGAANSMQASGVTQTVVGQPGQLSTRSFTQVTVTAAQVSGFGFMQYIADTGW